MEQRSRRIWELDALRGAAILWVILLHLCYDLDAFYGMQTLEHPVLRWTMAWAGEMFVILSGICATLGSRPLRRGGIIFGCAMVITGVTWAMAQLNFAGEDMVIRFGVLHLLGVCMAFWPLAGKLPTWMLAVLGTVIVALGLWFETFTVELPWLFPLGLTTATFSSGDYFPLAPFLGWFFLGAVAGRLLYEKKCTYFPHFPTEHPLIRFFLWCGRRSLLLYLLHQPVIFLILRVFCP